MKKIQTLCIIYQGQKILLGMKKRGFGAGRWNGFGGKLKDGENIEEAARREIREEAGIEAKDLAEVGIIDFGWSTKPEVLEVHIFRVTEFSGEPTESEEMRPEWFHVEQIPYEEMWSDDIHWLPLLLAGKKFRGKFLFDGDDQVLEYKIEEV